MGGFQSMFSAVAEFLLVAAIYYILHNRLRAVGVPKKSVTRYAVFHWLFLGILVVLSVVTQAGDLGKSATVTDPNPLVQSAFYTVHVNRTWAAFYVLRLIMQMEMITVGIVVLRKMKNGTRKAMKVFLFGSLVAYLIYPLSMMIIFFILWKPIPNVYDYPTWLHPLNIVLRGFLLVICVLCICIFAGMTSRVQWQLGAGRDIKEEQPPGMVYTGRELDSSQYLGQEIDSNRYLNPQFQVHHEMQGQEQYPTEMEGRGGFPSELNVNSVKIDAPQ